MPRPLRIRPWQVFLLIFTLLSVLYWPARNGGWVSDTLGWLDAVQHLSFNDFINRSGFAVHSLYQTTQLATWSCYRLLGANRIAWHQLHIALQALNAALLFAFFRRLLEDAGLARARGVALSAVLLFSLSPSLSEVIVWEAAFHYLQGLGFILALLLLLQAFLHKARIRLALAAGLLYSVASFSLELFYLTPAFSLLLLLFYRFGRPAADPGVIRRAARSFLLPQLLVLAAHLLLLRISYGDSTGRLGAGIWQQPLSYYAIKPPDYVLHLLGGRWLPQEIRSAWHRFCCTYIGAGLFYAGLACSISFTAFRFRNMSAAGQIAGWSWCATLLGMVLVTPMWFPERLLVNGDRYLYIMLPFFSLLPCLAISRIPAARLGNGLMLLLIGGAAAGAGRLALMWQQSEQLTAAMQRRLPPVAPGTAMLILNVPANYRGIPMIGAGPDGEFALMRRLLYPDLPQASVADVFAAEYAGPSAPVGVEVLGGSRFRIGLQNGGRWWFGADYANRFTGHGYTVNAVYPAGYLLRIDSTGPPLRLAVWTGDRYRTYSTDALTTH